MQKNIKTICVICFVLLMCMSFVLAACDTATEVEITSIKLDKNTLSLKVGDEATLTATVEPAQQAKDIVWTVNKEGIVTVDGGKVKAIAAGTAVVSAQNKSGTVYDSCTIVVEAKVNSVTLDKKTLELTVGEASSATVSDALLFANELDMIFQFEHVAMDVIEDWNVKPVDIVKLKKSFAKWQNGLFGRAWNALFWENHDQPRIVTRMGDENELRESSAKMLATCMYFMQGTPFVYQGQELGMINTRFYSKDEIRDIEVRNAWTKYVDGGLLSEKEFLKRISRRSRDTARTPMCWSDGKNAGFTDGTPWIKINDKYKQINVAEQSSRSDSVLNYYKSLFALRTKLSVVVDGAFKLIDEQNAHVVAYKRQNAEQTIAVVCNMTDKRLSFSDERLQRGKILLTNIENNYLADGILAPYQSIVIDLES